MVSLPQFFAEHPLFRTEDVASCRPGGILPATRKSLLAHHEKQGHILRVRRGLYASVPPGVEPHEAPVDPFLVAARATPDSVLAYHTALAFYGRTYSLSREFQFLTDTKAKPFRFRDALFRPVRFPKALAEASRTEVMKEERMGLDVDVTSLERTMVDVLDRPDLGGGWEEVWRSLESVEYFDLERVIEYALLLGNATTVSKVGFYLEQHRDVLMVEDRHLDHLREHRPSVPQYADAGTRGKARLVRAWNLLFPTKVIDRTWAEEE